MHELCHCRTCCEGGGVFVGHFEGDESVIDKDNIPRDAHLNDVLVVNVDRFLVANLLVLVLDGELQDVANLQINLSSTALQRQQGCVCVCVCERMYELCVCTIAMIVLDSIMEVLQTTICL